jgi:hypothetical protein
MFSRVDVVAANTPGSEKKLMGEDGKGEEEEKIGGRGGREGEEGEEEEEEEGDQGTRTLCQNRK